MTIREAQEKDRTRCLEIIVSCLYEINSRDYSEEVIDTLVEGYKEICHGGILSALLDEVMIYSIIAQGIITVTVQIEVKFKKPAKIGERLFLEGQITEDKGKILITEGKIFKQDGTIIAIAKGKFFRAEGEKKKELEANRDLPT